MPHLLIYIVPAVFALGGAIFGLGLFMYNHHQQQASRPRSNNRNRSANRSYDYVDGDNSCGMCFDRINEIYKKYLPCGHCFHINCIQTWLNISSTCPMCKTSIFL